MTADVPAAAAKAANFRRTVGRGQEISWPFFLSIHRGSKPMIPQKFIIGQLVDFDTRIEPTPRTKGPYEVLRVLPADDEMKPRVYRIKSQAEPFERNVNEYEIVAVG